MALFIKNEVCSLPFSDFHINPLIPQLSAYLQRRPTLCQQISSLQLAFKPFMHFLCSLSHVYIEVEKIEGEKENKRQKVSEGEINGR